MLKAIANRSFRRSDTREWVKRNKVIEGPENYIRELERLGSVRQVAAIEAAPENKASPQTAAGKPSSASPAAPASRRQTSKPSAGGGKKVGKKAGKKASKKKAAQS